MRIGFGYDVHKLVSNRELILGSVNIPFDKGLLGHSDADVLIHAIIDALLGSVTKGDIGTLFPSTDDKYQNIKSTLLLKEVAQLLKIDNYEIINIDSTIVCQQPILANYIYKMRDNISKILEVSIDRVSIKATTTEGLGFEGRGEGITAYAVVCIE